jgi:hypothetical protein
METYYIHTRTGQAQCGIRYATPINPTADETKDLSNWTRFDLDAFWEGLNGIEPIGAMTESVSNPAQTTDDRKCEHQWVNKAGAGYRENPVEVCIKCGEEL